MGLPPEQLDVEAEFGEVINLGEGLVRSEIRQVCLTQSAPLPRGFMR